eukprot:Colp12_sorted_trinity150504_noHs@29573
MDFHNHILILSVVFAAVISGIRSDATFGLQRPPPEERKFISPAVEEAITSIASRMLDKDLANIFANCLPNTLDTTVLSFTNGSQARAFVITGDIPAMWLRDSTNQVLPYIAFANKDENLKQFLCGVIREQAVGINHDPFANAFNPDKGGHEDHANDLRVPPMTPKVFEGKYELDSLAAFLKLSWQYFNETKDTSCFDADWLTAAETTIATIKKMQAGSLEEFAEPAYKFQRETFVATDTLPVGGRGIPAKRCGLSKCMFRPSDDAVSLPFLVPANAMAAVELEHVTVVLEALGRKESAKAAADLAHELRHSLEKEARQHHPRHGEVYAYEVDGYGGRVFMDDANIPSLLSLPYLGYVDRFDHVYRNTRALVLSDSNPYFFSGPAGQGVGGPHIGLNYVWPMGIIMQALTAIDDAEVVWCLQQLKRASAGSGFMHESFSVNDVNDYTRSWFAWANTLFGELILTLATERPHLLFGQ